MTASPVTPICAVLLIVALPTSGFVVFGSPADPHNGTGYRAYEVQTIADWEAAMVSPMFPGWSPALCGATVRFVRGAVRGLFRAEDWFGDAQSACVVGTTSW